MTDVIKVYPNGQIELSDGFFVIPEFNDLKKEYNESDLKKYLKFIALCLSKSSPYDNASEDLRKINIMKDMQLKDIPAKVQIAYDKYKTLYWTPLRRLVEGSKTAINRTADFLESVDFTEIDDKGKLVYDPAKVQRVINDISKTVNTVSELEKLLKQENTKDEVVYGGAQFSELPEMQ